MQSKDKYDIVVAGAGIAGIAASVKAASMGASVLLIEHYPFLGGMSSAGMVSPFMKSKAGNIDLVKGIFWELEAGMSNLGGMIDNGFYAWAFRATAFDLLRKVRVDIAFSSDVVKVNVEGKTIESITIANRFGLSTVFAKQFIDTTGDAQLIVLGGFPWLKGDEKTGKLQAMTLFFRMGGIDVRRTAEYCKNNPNDFLPWMDFEFNFEQIISIAGFKGLIKEAQANHEMPKEIEYIFFTTMASTGEASFNTTNILNIDASSSEQLTFAERTGHKQVAMVVDFLQRKIPGFENAFLIDTAPQVGVRETRRALADYMVTGEDILSGARFEDSIARGCYGIDIHGQSGETSRMDELGEGQWYEIPLRSLMVKDVENLMAAGRCIGATREGHAALRIMPTSAATGEACGAVAALSIKKCSSIREVQYQEIRKSLIHNIEN
ncbi:MAG: FAD-dependent oxidoreductase [Bacteroides sp.]|jgi:hypothetical protein|nr:FAD-dependent oxidoreductase [Bacteroides sp.]